MAGQTAPSAMEKLLMVTVLILAFGGMMSITALLFSGAPGDVFLGTLLFLLIIAMLVSTVVSIRSYSVLKAISEGLGKGVASKAKKGKKNKKK